MLKTVCVVLAMSSVVMGCGTGCYEYQGLCACDAKTEAAPVVKPSDEKPPHGTAPEWQTGAVKADMPQSLQDSDAKMDKEASDADHAGKRAAGIQ